MAQVSGFGCSRPTSSKAIQPPGLDALPVDSPITFHVVHHQLPLVLSCKGQLGNFVWQVVIQVRHNKGHTMHDVLADLPLLMVFHLFDMGSQSRFILLPICHNCILDDFQTVMGEATVVLRHKNFSEIKTKIINDS